MALQGVNPKDDNNPKPSEASRNFVVGRWQVEQLSGSRSAGSVADYQDDGTLTGSVTQFVNGFGQKQLVAGCWNFEKVSKDTFRLQVRFNNQSTWQGTFKILDQDHIQNIDENYVSVRMK
jgi:hypothetical protein